MDPKLTALYLKLKAQGITPVQESLIRAELAGPTEHQVPVEEYDPPVEAPKETRERKRGGDRRHFFRNQSLYAWNDFPLQALTPPHASSVSRIGSLDELLDRDRQREIDGFPRKIRVGRLIKPGQSGKERVIVVPTTVEEKFIHDHNFKEEEEGESSGGNGEGEEGEVIGEQPVRQAGQHGQGGPGQGEGGSHEIESNAYDLGRILTEKFELPNLKDKGKKRSLVRYTYDMTDRHRGFGQLLDKKATLRRIVETNIALGNVPDPTAEIDPSGFIIAPDDKIYRVLSREKDYESQAMVFFVRDYSGSMYGKSTVLVVTQHILIYSWLLYQYARQVETRFILHDTDAREVPDFYSYYNSTVAGGTQVSSGYRLVNEIIEKENLTQDYNIYVFHGTDGDDWDTNGREAIPELRKMLRYANRVGVTIAEHGYGRKSEVQRYLENSGLLKVNPGFMRLDVVNEDADESRLIDGIKHLISE